MSIPMCFGLYFELLKNTSNNCLYVQLTELSSSLLGILNSSMDLYGLKNRPFLKYGNFSNCLTSAFEGVLPNSLNNRPIPKQTTKDKDETNKTTFLCFFTNTKISRQDRWGRRIRTSGWRDQNPLPYHLAMPQCFEGRGLILICKKYSNKKISQIVNSPIKLK